MSFTIHSTKYEHSWNLEIFVKALFGSKVCRLHSTGWVRGFLMGEGWLVQYMGAFVVGCTSLEIK